METLMQNITSYLNALDWMYILTFILISYIFNYCKITSLLAKWTKITIKTRYRVSIIGFIYAVVIYFIRGYSLSQIEILFASFLFALVFHKLILEILVSKIFPMEKSSTPKTPTE